MMQVCCIPAAWDRDAGIEMTAVRTSKLSPLRWHGGGRHRDSQQGKVAISNVFFDQLVLLKSFRSDTNFVLNTGREYSTHESSTTATVGRSTPISCVSPATARDPVTKPR